MKIKLFIDFDGTLFDTSKFKRGMFDIFEKAGFTSDQVLTAYQAECLDAKFSITGLIERLKKDQKFNVSLAEARVSDLYAQAAKMVYEDTEEFLQKIDRNRYQIIMLTLGDPSFQHKKVENSGLEKYFDEILYTELQKWDYLDRIVKKNEKFVIVDDRADAISKIAKKFPNSLALYIDRKSADKDDPVRNASGDVRLHTKNFHQVMMYL